MGIPLHSSSECTAGGTIVKPTILHTGDHNLTVTGADPGSNHHDFDHERLALVAVRNSGG